MRAIKHMFNFQHVHKIVLTVTNFTMCSSALLNQSHSQYNKASKSLSNNTQATHQLIGDDISPVNCFLA